MTDSGDQGLDGAPSGETPEDNREMPWAASAWMWMEPQPAPSGEAPRTPAEVPAATFDPHIRHALSALERATKEMDAAFSDDTFRAFNRTWCALFAAIESYAQRRALSGLPQPTPSEAATEAVYEMFEFHGYHRSGVVPKVGQLALSAAYRAQFGSPPSPPKEGPNGTL